MLKSVGRVNYQTVEMVMETLTTQLNTLKMQENYLY